LLGGCILRNASIFWGLACMPRFDNMHPNNCPFHLPKTHFFGLSLRPFRLMFVEGFSQVYNVIFLLIAHDNNVINLG
jgi:hypothetical protein